MGGGKRGAGAPGGLFVLCFRRGKERAVRGNRGEEVPAWSEGAGRTRGADMACSEGGCPARVPRGDTNTAPAPRVIHTHDLKHETRRTHPEKEAPALSGDC